MRAKKPVRLGAIVAAALLGVMPLRAMAEEPDAISAFMVWQGHGEVVETAPGEATFIGSLAGAVYVNTDEGPVEAGQMQCPAVVRIERDGKQTGSGNCTMTAEDGARLYSALTCSGVHFVGCSGNTTLSGGTGRFEGASGEGAFTLRSNLHTLEPTSQGSAIETAHGIIFWPELHYRLP
jgi:hypothetical protein